MAPHEFDQWVQHHTALFPSMIGWLEKLTSDQRTATLAAWSRLLAGVTLDAAKIASDRMTMGETIPRYERHPATIAKMAKRDDDFTAKARTTAKFGPETIECRDCNDTGRIDVYLIGVSLVRWMRNARGSKRSPIEATGVMRCGCESGRVLWGHLPQYDPNTHDRAIGHPGVHLKGEATLREKRLVAVDEAESVMTGGST